MEETSAKVKKAELTRQKIVDAAMELFHERGYDETTMRLIAQKAGVSTGNAYYYFPSKEALMQGYYLELYERFAVEANKAMRGKKEFSERLKHVIYAWLDVAEPYHEFASTFFRHAADPKSSVSPFSEESAPSRDAVIEIFSEVIEGSEKLKMADEVRSALPRLLWMYHMSVVLFWVYDSSEDQKKTRLLVRKTAPLIDRLVGLSRLPVLKSSAKEIVKLFDDLMTK